MDDSEQKQDNGITKLNIALASLILFIIAYSVVLLYSESLKSNTNSTQQTTNSLQNSIVNKKKYSVGELVYIKHFNIRGVVKENSISNYVVVYKDNESRLNEIVLPPEFLYKTVNKPPVLYTLTK